MKGIINNIINFYQMQAKALGVLVANTQKALEQSEKERKANEQIQRVENFVKDLIMNLNNMLTKFYWLKERKKRRHEEMTQNQVKVLVDFANFVRTLTRNIHSLLARFQKVNSKTFDEKIDKEMEELEDHVNERLKEYDEVLSGTSDTLKYRLSKYVSNKLESVINKFFKRKSFVPEEPEKTKLGSLPPHRLEDAPTDSTDSRDTQLERFINVLDTNAGGSSSKKSERQIHSKV